MLASVRYEYGPPSVLRLEEVDTPEPADDEVLIKVRAASANLGDWEVLRGDPPFIAVMATVMGPKPRVRPRGAPSRGGRGLFPPKYEILGCDFAGTVEQVGRGVTRYAVGDDLLGMCTMCAFAEYVCIKQNDPVARKPATLSFEHAAALPQAAYIAIQGIRDVGRVTPGADVLVNGAGGGAGTLAVQYARHLGARVTAVDNGGKLDMLRSIGADDVIDYTQHDYTKSGPYDVILDLAAHRSIFDARRALRPGGIYVVAGGGMAATFQSMLLGALLSRVTRSRTAFLMADTNEKDLELAVALVQAGALRPVIDGTYSLSEVPHALEHMGEGRALGKVIVVM